MMIAAIAMLAAGGLFYYHQSHGDNVAIQTISGTAGSTCTRSSDCSKTFAGCCNGGICESWNFNQNMKCS
jgi:hypothetical protein